MHCKASTRKWQAFLAVVIRSVHRTVFLAMPENDTHDAEPARHYISRVASRAAPGPNQQPEAVIKTITHLACGHGCYPRGDAYWGPPRRGRNDSRKRRSNLCVAPMRRAALTVNGRDVHAEVQIGKALSRYLCGLGKQSARGPIYLKRVMSCAGPTRPARRP